MRDLTRVPARRQTRQRQPRSACGGVRPIVASEVMFSETETEAKMQMEDMLLTFILEIFLEEEIG
jgi:hypothetical protein